uniref:Uncharacterized protein n=1 Tax=Candidatus Kentrum sp. LPFa TaxID=2126335 RepID=A0A450W1P8_9GAMM|nr:MAG: hypothetical protein BECKLPF1236B_GA0070989_10189 [Candidatus Kentron sp. LPFa]
MLAPISLDLPLSLVARALADGQHDDDRTHPEDDAEHGQPRAQLVEQQALESQPDDADKRVIDF